MLDVLVQVLDKLLDGHDHFGPLVLPLPPRMKREPWAPHGQAPVSAVSRSSDAQRNGQARWKWSVSYVKCRGQIRDRPGVSGLVASNRIADSVCA